MRAGLGVNGAIKSKLGIFVEIAVHGSRLNQCHKYAGVGSAFQSVLRRHVGSPHHKRGVSQDRAVKHDAPALLCSHGWNHSARQVMPANEIRGIAKQCRMYADLASYSRSGSDEYQGTLRCLPHLRN